MLKILEGIKVRNFKWMGYPTTLFSSLMFGSLEQFSMFMLTHLLFTPLYNISHSVTSCPVIYTYIENINLNPD